MVYWSLPTSLLFSEGEGAVLMSFMPMQTVIAEKKLYSDSSPLSVISADVITLPDAILQYEWNVTVQTTPVVCG